MEMVQSSTLKSFGGYGTSLTDKDCIYMVVLMFVEDDVIVSSPRAVVQEMEEMRVSQSPSFSMGSGILHNQKFQEGALTRRFARRAAAAAEEASRPSTSASEAPLETGALAVPPPWVAQLFADLDSRVSETMKATLQPVERQM
ncbi:hypothetical protein CJ030_MR3G009427 [Morella rubra]|uniref:Uncharacterized protein n=1 Tax=Morella rubra TaxID=262757 RepID=A0A6A1W6U3_9ROSI|nr:hypothetical protein CJ030_MR3G009427 [Morella rubra]